MPVVRGRTHQAEVDSPFFWINGFSSVAFSFSSAVFSSSADSSFSWFSSSAVFFSSAGFSWFSSSAVFFSSAVSSFSWYSSSAVFSSSPGSSFSWSAAFSSSSAASFSWYVSDFSSSSASLSFNHLRIFRKMDPKLTSFFLKSMSSHLGSIFLITSLWFSTMCFISGFGDCVEVLLFSLQMGHL